MVQEEAFGRTDYRPASRGRSGTCPGSQRSRGVPVVGGARADLLPLAKGVRRSKDGSGQAVEGPRAGEHSLEEGGCRPDLGQADSAGGHKGKRLSPARRRQWAAHVCKALGVSERRACRVLSQPRSTQRHRCIAAPDEDALRRAIVTLAGRFGRYGYRRVTALLRRAGWRVNHKRVERIWRREGLRVPQKQPKRGRLWLNDGSCVRLRPCSPNHVWGLRLRPSPHSRREGFPVVDGHR